VSGPSFLRMRGAEPELLKKPRAHKLVQTHGLLQVRSPGRTLMVWQRRFVSSPAQYLTLKIVDFVGWVLCALRVRNKGGHATLQSQKRTTNTPPSHKIDGDMTEDHDEETNGQPTQFVRDEAFCSRMRWAIAAGLENAPIGVVTTPGTKNPRYIPAEPLPLASSQRAMEHA